MSKRPVTEHLGLWQLFQSALEPDFKELSFINKPKSQIFAKLLGVLGTKWHVQQFSNTNWSLEDGSKNINVVSLYFRLTSRLWMMSLNLRGVQCATTNGHFTIFSNECLHATVNCMSIIYIPEQESTTLGKTSIEKKTFSFGHCPNYLNPPPHDPNSGNLVLFFRKSKFKIWKSV